MEAVQETGNLIASDKVQGTNVYNAAGDNLGAIHDVMIDKPSGKVAYAIMTFGGFLSMGNQYHPLPWSVLKYDTKPRLCGRNFDRSCFWDSAASDSVGVL